MSYKSYFSLCYDQDNERKSQVIIPEEDEGTTGGEDIQSEYDGENSGYNPAADGCGGENGCCPINFDEIERKLSAQKELAQND